jgi:hypothetical protein
MAMEINEEVELEEVDEFKFNFNELEAEYTSSTTPETLIDKYITVLSNARNDDEAIKIKETAVYRLAK